VGPSIVSITSTVVYRDFFNVERTGTGSGSGVIYGVSADAVDILTNEHVIADAREVIVQLKADMYYKAEIIGKDKSTDLAIIRVSAKDVPSEVLSQIKAARFGDSDQIRVGETAIAIGNPLGYNNTVTVGVISAVDREIKDKNSLKLIQTDAAINPGNSGGALVNTRGEVIGINTIKISDTQVEGIGFAIPSNSVVPVVNELASKGFVSRPYLGIYGAEISPEAAEAYDIPVGILVRGVIEGSGAEQAGLKAEDVIIEVDDKRIENMTQLSDILMAHEIGDVVRVRVVRSGSTLELNVTLMDANS
jgi:serine protease Do